MKPPSEKQAAAEIVDLLADLLDSSPKKIRSQAAAANGYDYSISVPGHRFLVEYKVSASAGPLAGAVDQLKKYADAHQDKGLPLIVVPFMGQVGRELCDRSGYIVVGPLWKCQDRCPRTQDSRRRPPQ